MHYVSFLQIFLKNIPFRLCRKELFPLLPYVNWKMRRGFDYKAVKGLSQEASEKLSASQPLTLGQASRIPGVRKSDVALLYIALSKRPR